MLTYEYLMVVSAVATNWADIRLLPEGGRPPVEYKPRQWIWRPNAKAAEERQEPSMLPIFNELGREGWKLVDSAVTHTRIEEYTGLGGSNFYGQTGEIGAPVQSRYIMMREVGS